MDEDIDEAPPAQVDEVEDLELAVERSKKPAPQVPLERLEIDSQS